MHVDSQTGCHPFLRLLPSCMQLVLFEAHVVCFLARFHVVWRCCVHVVSQAKAPAP